MLAAGFKFSVVVPYICTLKFTNMYVSRHIYTAGHMLILSHRFREIVSHRL